MPSSLSILLNGLNYLSDRYLTIDVVDAIYGNIMVDTSPVDQPSN